MPKTGSTYGEKQSLLVRKALRTARERRLSQHQCGEQESMPVIYEELPIVNKHKKD